MNKSWGWWHLDHELRISCLRFLPLSPELASCPLLFEHPSQDADKTLHQMWWPDHHHLFIGITSCPVAEVRFIHRSSAFCLPPTILRVTKLWSVSPWNIFYINFPFLSLVLGLSSRSLLPLPRTTEKGKWWQPGFSVIHTFEFLLCLLLNKMPAIIYLNPLHASSLIDSFIPQYFWGTICGTVLGTGFRHWILVGNRMYQFTAFMELIWEERW